MLLPGRAEAQQPVSQLTLTSGGERAHIFPTTVIQAAAVRQFAPDLGPLLYHAGGSIIPTATTYAIFWFPSKLQNGVATSMSLHYRAVLQNMLKDYAGHGIGNNNTQYYQIIALKETFIQNKGGFGGSYTDSSAYPASGCTDTATPGNCVTDAQIRAEITAQGNEIADLCSYTYGVNTWNAGKANQMWNGHYYELQQEYDNHKAACVQLGP